MSKFCPVMGLTSGVMAFAAVNGAEVKMAKELMKKPAFACVGSQCAWWRWVNDKDNEGLCGIAGINHTAAFNDPAQEET